MVNEFGHPQGRRMGRMWPSSRNEPLQGDWLRCGPPNGFPTLFSTEARHVGEARQDEAAQRVDNEWTMGRAPL